MLVYSGSFSSFSTNNLAEAKTFYGSVLGISITESMGLLHLDLGNGQKAIVYPKPDHQPATFTVLNFTVDDIVVAVDQLTAGGVAFEQYDWGQQKTDAKGIMWGTPNIAWFKDPAGNILAVMEIDEK